MNTNTTHKRTGFTKNIFPQIEEGSFVSKCMFCGSAAYGSGCIYSSHGRHIHTDDPSKCIYCGSLSYGSGCIFNPHNNMHIHGVDASQSIKETVRKTVELSYLTDRLLSEISDSEAYKLGLINKDGKQIRTPNNIHEANLVSPLSKTLYKLRKFLPPDSCILKESLSLLNDNDYKEEDQISSEMYKDYISLKKDINYNIKSLIHTLRENYSKLPLEMVEKIIEDAILDNI